jgi:hypothetical protein
MVTVVFARVRAPATPVRATAQQITSRPTAANVFVLNSPLLLVYRITVAPGLKST